MKCVEVNELIQRQLDLDLSDIEQHRLNQHMDVCSDCKSFYERLRHVHLDLESLPKVILPFSIVDSILPEIDRLDHLKSESTTIENGHTKNWLVKNKWISGITAVAAGVVMIFAITQLIGQKGINNVASDQTNHTMQVSGLALADPELTETSKAPMMKSKVMEDHINQDSNSLEVALTSDVDISDQSMNNKENFESSSMLLADATNTTENEDTLQNNEVENPAASSQNHYGIAQQNEDDKGLTITPTFTAQTGIDQKLMTLESPDHSFIAMYNDEQILIEDANGNSLMEIKAEANEQIGDLVWLSATELQYSVRSDSDKQKWNIDVNSGIKTQKHNE